MSYSMPTNAVDSVISEISARRSHIYEYINSDRLRQRYFPEHARDAVFSYAQRPGKGLRGTACLLACGAVGGRERESAAMPAAAATEVHHIWSLIHDDIIDMDVVRKGGPTVHIEFKQRAIEEFGYDTVAAERYGIAMAILGGDGGAGLVFICLSDLFQNPQINPDVAQLIIRRYADTFIPAAIEGQSLDLQYEGRSVTDLTEDDLMKVALKKTGSFFSLGGYIGSLIGVNEPNPDHPYVQAMNEFTTKSGLVLQLTDDLLNVVGDAANMGKAVGSDIVMGKKTFPLVYALNQANSAQQEQLLSCYGKPATEAQLYRAIQLIDELGGVAYTRDLVSRIVDEALACVSQLPKSSYIPVLSSWIKWISTREI